MGPFDLTGGPFLALYAALFGVAVVFSVMASRMARPPGRNGLVRDEDELAVLAGGSSRLAETVLARLMANGALKVEKRQLVRSEGRGGTASLVDRRILELSTPFAWQTAVNQVQAFSVAMLRRLADAGLIMDAAELWRLRLLQALPFVFLLSFGAVKVWVGTMRGKPVGFLIVFLFATALVGLFRFVVADRRTVAGLELVKTEAARADRLRRAPVSDETGHAVALFGTAVLAGSAFADLHRLRRSVEGGGGDVGSDGGGGGCGGGGCGGCGGCGG